MQGIAANDRLQPFAAVWALTFRDRHGILVDVGLAR